MRSRAMDRARPGRKCQGWRPENRPLRKQNLKAARQETAWEQTVARAGAYGPQTQRAHQQQVQRDVDRGGQGHEEERADGIPQASQHAAHGVVAQHEKGAAADDQQIAVGQGQGLAGYVHGPQDGPAGQQA